MSRLAQEMSGEFREALSSLPARSRKAGEDRVSGGPALGTISCRELARDHRPAKLSLGEIVGGLHILTPQEGEELTAMLEEVFCESLVLGIRELVAQEPVQTPLQASQGHGEAMPGHLPATLSKLKGTAQDLRHLSGEQHCSAGVLLLEFPTSLQKMCQTELPRHIGQDVIRRQTVLGGHLDNCTAKRTSRDFFGVVDHLLMTAVTGKHKLRQEHDSGLFCSCLTTDFFNEPHVLLRVFQKRTQRCDGYSCIPHVTSLLANMSLVARLSIACISGIQQGRRG